MKRLSLALTVLLLLSFIASCSSQPTPTPVPPKPTAAPAPTAAPTTAAAKPTTAPAPTAAPTAKPQPTSAPLPSIVVFAASGVGSMGNLMAAGFGKAIEANTTMKSKIVVSGSDTGRIGLVRSGEAQFTPLAVGQAWTSGFGQGDFATAAWGPQRMRWVYTGNSYPTWIATLGDSKIFTAADLKGKRLPWTKGHLGAIGEEAILAGAGLTWNDVVKVDFADWTQTRSALLDGVIDATWASATTPVTEEIAASPKGGRYVEGPDPQKYPEVWKKMNAILPLTPLWGNFGAILRDKPTWVFDLRAGILTYDFVNEELVYQVVKSLDKGYDMFKGIQAPDSGEYTLANTLKHGWVVPWHPGVIRYAKEKNLWTPQLEAEQQQLLKEEAARISSWKPPAK